MKLKGGAAALLSSLIVLAIAAPSAQAASTRAEYVAQVDPICQSVLPAEIKAAKAFARAFKQLDRQVRSGASPQGATNKLAKRAVRFIRRINGLESGATTQIEAVPPAPSDVSIVALWLQGRREAERFASNAVAALRHRKLRAAVRALNQSSTADNEARAWVASFGFQYCA